MKADLLCRLTASGVIVAALIGCNGNSSADTTTSNTTSVSGGAKGDANAKPVEVAFITNNASDYWTIARKGVEKAKTEVPNVTVDFEIPGDASVAGQKQTVDDMISKGVQGIAISPINPADQTPLINETAKKILVFTQDSDAPKSDRACYIGTDNVEAGKSAGEQVKKALPNGGKIMVFVGSKDVQNARDRYTGLQQALKGTKIQILDIRTDETDRAKAVSNVSDALVKNPDLAGAVGLWSYNGPAIINAVKAAGKAGKVKIVCFDSEPDTITGIKDGTIDATIVQQPFTFGEKSIQIMAQVLRGDKSAIPPSKQIIVPTKVIDKNSVDAFVAEQKQLLGK